MDLLASLKEVIPMQIPVTGQREKASDQKTCGGLLNMRRLAQNREVARKSAQKGICATIGEQSVEADPAGTRAPTSTPAGFPICYCVAPFCADEGANKIFDEMPLLSPDEGVHSFAKGSGFGFSFPVKLSLYSTSYFVYI